MRVIFTSGAGDARGVPIAEGGLGSTPRRALESGGQQKTSLGCRAADQTSRPAPATKTPDLSRRFASGVPEQSLSVALARNHPCITLKAT